MEFRIAIENLKKKISGKQKFVPHSHLSTIFLGNLTCLSVVGINCGEMIFNWQTKLSIWLSIQLGVIQMALKTLDSGRQPKNNKKKSQLSKSFQKLGVMLKNEVV